MLKTKLKSDMLILPATINLNFGKGRLGIRR